MIQIFHAVQTIKKFAFLEEVISAVSVFVPGTIYLFYLAISGERFAAERRKVLKLLTTTEQPNDFVSY